MGKPFKSELLNLKDTYEWASNVDLDLLHKTIVNINSPIYFVGSGGSLSACYYAVALAEQKGKFAKAVTPLELYNLKNTIRNVSIVFISASGKNSDILFGFKTAIKFEAICIICICMQTNSKLAELSLRYSISSIYEFSLPVGKDGFLATNSLIAYFTILHRLYSSEIEKIIFINESSLKEIEIFSNSLSPHTSITVLYGGYSKPIAYDIESKSVEAALYPILLSDFRNFGHGRHHWYAKKNETAAIICISTSDEQFLAEKTLDALPDNIPKLLLKTDKNSSLGSLDLLIQSFYLIDKFGENLNIDPGRPGVPEFGRKLYNLKYSNALNNSENNFGLSIKARTAISRKIDKSITTLTNVEMQSWSDEYQKYLNKFKNIFFGAIVFDYDGTLCSEKRKHEGPDPTMTNMLKNIVNNGFYIGVVTGRGKSVRTDLQKIIPQKNWSQILIGYYNGSEIGLLNDDSIPNLKIKMNANLKYLHEKLLKYSGLKIEFAARPNQLTIEFKGQNNFSEIKGVIIQTIRSSGLENIELLESGHSIDIIPSKISKTDILNPLKKILETNQLPTNLLCIGDKGRWPGNDYRLLDTPYSLSVYEVNNRRNNCWNLASPGLTHTDATLEYLKLLTFERSGMKLNLKK